jgi:hypothetical protein
VTEKFQVAHSQLTPGSLAFSEADEVAGIAVNHFSKDRSVMLTGQD